MIKLLIIADDFTGALDTGVQFAVSGVQTLVTTNDNYDFSMGRKPEVLVMDAETRHKNPEEAYETVFEIAKQAKTAGILNIYKKTDSALRGNIGSELQAVLDGTGLEELPFLPAFPQMNRITKSGIQYVDGIPVHESVFGKDPFEPVTCSYIPDIIGLQSKIEAVSVMSGKAESRESGRRIAVYDIERESQLYEITSELHRQGRLSVMAGCAGAAAVLPKVLGLNGKKPDFPMLDKHLLVVCGSVNPITKAQLDYAEKHGFNRIRFRPEEKLDLSFWEGAAGKQRIRELVFQAKHCPKLILDTNDPEDSFETMEYSKAHGLGIQEVRYTISTVLGMVVKKIIEEGIRSTMLLTGGDTLLGFMNQMNVQELQPVGELDMGTVLSGFETRGNHYYIISKSGGFGAENLFQKIADTIGQERRANMLKKYMLKMPRVVYSGEGALENIRSVMEHGVKKAAVFTDKGIEAAGLLEMPLRYIRESGVEVQIFDEIPAEPTCDQVQEVVEQFKRSGSDFIIAVGGGSVIDTAKLASVLVTDRYGVRDLLENPALASKCVKTLMIPTTAGTGAEATPNSIVSVPEKELKVGIVNEDMISDYVILDAEMIKKLPRSIAAATGVDALAHAIECFTSKKANPFSDLYALEALDLIMNHIEQACDNPDAMEAKNKMLLAAFYAGVAITASGTTAVHALSYPLGGKYHIPHGISNAIMLKPVMTFNEPYCQNLFARAYERVAKNQTAKTVEEKSAWMLNRMSEIVKNLDIPTSLKDYGVPKEDLEILVESGMNVRRLLVNNIREVTEEDARNLYLEIL